jgi:hypothetical protein
MSPRIAAEKVKVGTPLRYRLGLVCSVYELFLHEAEQENVICFTSL